MKPNLICLATLLATLPFDTYATSDGPDRFAVRGVARNDILTVRVAPGSESRKIAGLPPNAKGLVNLGCVTLENGKINHDPSDLSPHPRWCKIRLGTVTGWVAARYLGED